MGVQTLVAGEKVTIHFTHKYVRLVSATGVLHVVGLGSKVAGFDVGAGEIINFDEAISIVVTNNLDISNTFEFRDSPVPVGNTSGMTVDINNMPPMTIAEGQAVAVGEVGFPVDASLGVNNFPANQAVTVGNFPETQMVGGWVVVDNDVTLAAGQKIKKDASGSYVGLAAKTFVVAGAQTIAGNATRKELHIKAGITNSGYIWTGGADGVGIPLGAGEAVVFEGTADFIAYGDTLGDVLYVAEVVE